MPSSLQFSSDQFRSLMTLFQYISNNCQDLTIKEGKVHQITSSKTLLFDIDLTKYFGNNNVYVNNLAQHHSILNMYGEDNNPVQLVFDKDTYVWMDKFSKLDCRVPTPEDLNPKYIETSSSVSTKIKAITNKIFSIKMDQSILKRISKASSVFKANTLFLRIFEDTATFYIVEEDKGTEKKFNVISTNELEFEKYNCDIKYDIKSFLLPSVEDLTLTVYENSMLNNMLITVYDTTLNKIPIKLWGISVYSNLNEPAYE